MRYCDNSNLVPGMVLAKPLYSANRELLLARGYELDAPMISRLLKMGISPVCIEEAGTEGIVIDDLVDNLALHAAQGSIEEAFREIMKTTKGYAEEELESVICNLQSSGFAVPLHSVKKTISSLVDEILDNMVTKWTILPIKFVAGEQFKHGVDVAILSVLIGIHFQYQYKDLIHLAYGAAIHDIGMSLIPELFDKKRFEFSEDEWAQYRRHPQYGISLLANSEENIYIEKEIVHQHHEQPDGSGFPQGLMGSHQPPTSHASAEKDRIFRMAEIIHVADAYLNITTGRWPLEPFSPEDAVAELLKDSPLKYNIHTVVGLSSVVSHFPLGSLVRIVKNNSHRYVGHCGVVAIPNPSEPHKPVLIIISNRYGQKINPIQVDFSDEKTMEIKLAV